MSKSRESEYLGAANRSSPIDPARFTHLGEAEVLRRIAALLTTALVRSGRFRSPTLSKPSATEAFPAIDPLTLIRHSGQRRLAQFLRHAGPTAPCEMATALNMDRRTVARQLRRLSAAGICEVTGRTRGARYRLCVDYSRN